MTNKMKLFFVIVATASFTIVVLLSTQFAFDIADQLLLTTLSVFGLYETPILLVLSALAIPGMFLVFHKRRRS
jgi:hypothetical protein